MEGRHTLLVGGAIVVLAVGGYLLYSGGYFVSEPTLEELENEITLTGLAPGDYVTSPLSFSGRADEAWFNEEGIFAIELRDDNGAVIGTGQATATGGAEQGRRPFTASLSFGSPAGDRGTIMFMRSNVTGPSQNNFNYGFTVLFTPPVQEE